MFQRIGIGVFAGIFLMYAAISAQPKPGWTQYLLSGGITCLTAAQGRVWIGTYSGGLVSYDTASGAVSRYTNANSILPCNRVWDLTTGPDNRLWVATNRGLVWFNGQTWGGFDTASVPWRGGGVFDVTLNDAGALYVSRSDGGVFRTNGSAWESLLDLYPGFPMDLASRGARLGCSDEALWSSSSFNSLSSMVSRFAGGKWTTWTGLQTTGFASDRHGGVWFAYRLVPEFAGTTPREKLVRGTDTSWDEFMLPDSIHGSLSVVIDSRDSAWVQATAGKGNRPVFARRSGSAWDVISFPDSTVVKGSATWSAIDGLDRIWSVLSVSLYQAGETPRKTGTLMSYVNGAWKAAAEIADDNLPYGVADALVCAAGDSVWMVSRSSKNPGVFNGTRWDLIPTSQLPGFDNLTGAGIDARGALWLIGEYSCFERRTGGWVLHSMRRDLPVTIQCSAFDHAGNAWVSMAESFYSGSPLVNGHLLHYNGAAWTEVTRLPPGSDSMPGFTAMACAPDSSLWCIAADSILMRYKPDSGWSDCRAALEKAGNVYPRSLLFDKKGVCWLGTAAKGLWRWDGRGLMGFNAITTNLPGSMDVKPLAVDTTGAVWCRLQRRGYSCYYYNGVKYCYDVLTIAGLGRFDGVAWSFFSQSNSGLPSDDVKSVAFDKKGRMWAGTAEGIGMFDPAQTEIKEHPRQRMYQAITSKNPSKASRLSYVFINGKSLAADCAGKKRPQILYDIRGRLVKAKRIGSSIFLRRSSGE
jgi:streptogramin lyase